MKHITRSHAAVPVVIGAAVLLAAAVLAPRLVVFAAEPTGEALLSAVPTLTDEEIARVMPGDEALDNPKFNATRAVTIEASPEEIWPWIVQIGYRRAGFYSYDRLDNNGIESARQSAIPRWAMSRHTAEVRWFTSVALMMSWPEPGT